MKYEWSYPKTCTFGGFAWTCYCWFRIFNFVNMIMLKSYIPLLNACVVLYVLSLFVIFVVKYTKLWKQIVNLKNISLYTYFLNYKYIISRAMCEVGSMKHSHSRSKIYLSRQWFACTSWITMLSNLVMIYIFMSVYDFNIILKCPYRVPYMFW